MIGFTLLFTAIYSLYEMDELFNEDTTHGPAHNYQIPNYNLANSGIPILDTLIAPEINKETEDWTGTTQDNMLDIDMDCGNDILILNQINYDLIPKYRIFTDVPAGTDTIIIVDEILYKMNNNKTAWTPIYPDEYVMWITNNGDTIWE